LVQGKKKRAEMESGNKMDHRKKEGGREKYSGVNNSQKKKQQRGKIDKKGGVKPEKTKATLCSTAEKQHVSKERQGDARSWVRPGQHGQRNGDGKASEKVVRQGIKNSWKVRPFRCKKRAKKSSAKQNRTKTCGRNKTGGGKFFTI